jgi:hypothetical protein
VQFNSVGNTAGLFGPWLLGVVVGRTCSYNVAFYIMGGLLCLGGLLVHLVEDAPKEGSRISSKNGSNVEMSLHQSIPHVHGDTSLPRLSMGDVSVLEES